MQVLASQLPSLANRNAELAVPPLFWPVNCIKIGGHVALLSGATVYSYGLFPILCCRGEISDGRRTNPTVCAKLSINGERLEEKNAK